MKRLALLTISSILAAGMLGGTAAFAATEETVYPQDGEFSKPLVFSSLTDYAADGQNYAFLDGGKLITVIDGEYKNDYDVSPSALDCADGVFYYSTSAGVYSLPDKTAADHVMQSSTRIDLGDYLYYFDNGGALTIYNMQSKESTTLDASYKNLKKYENTVYAISGNVLYKFNGALKEAVTLSYTDYSATQKINVGQAADALKNYSLKFVTVKKGSYITGVDLNSLDGEYFTVSGTNSVAADTTALLLGYTGNAALIAIGDSSYITLKTSTAEAAIDCYTQAEFASATITGTGIYSSPYAIRSTAVLDSAWGTVVAVRSKLVLDGVLGSAYYEVEYTEDGETKVGYVAEGFLTEFIIEDNKDPVEVKDPEYSEDNDIKKMILIFAVIVLILVAVGYLAYIGTSGKNKKTKSKPVKTSKTTKLDVEPNPVPDNADIEKIFSDDDDTL